MCYSVLASRMASRGISTKFRFRPQSALGALVAQEVPCGKVALFFGEEHAARAQALRPLLGGYAVHAVQLGQGAPPAGLFSLPDGVRVYIGVGVRGAQAARLAASLCGGVSFALPAAASARGLFEESVPAVGGGVYPARPADVVLFDAANVRGGDRARTALSALCAEEIAQDAVFAGLSRPQDFAPAAELLADAEAGERGYEKQFAASALYHAELRGVPPFAGKEAARVLRERTGQSPEACALGMLGYFAARAEALFSSRPRPYFVPDYAARIACAAPYGGGAAALFKMLCVPDAAQSFARSETFLQVRQKLAVRARLLSEYAARTLIRCVREGAQAPRFAERDLFFAYDRSAELSPLLSAPALEREFGFLPNPEGDLAFG